MARMLIVDGENSQRRALSAGLSVEGFEVAFAASSQEVFRILGASPIDVAMIDLMMPDLNGLELAREIRRAYPRVRVVLSSAYHLSARQVERTDCGAVAFVPKPYKVGEICRFLRAETNVLTPASC
ncbi:transcriptional regulator [Sorangium cellulosum]|uniref:Transcriptional regulator n=1 Tax=Sorangium cellulosum TaxID=56 RepID=A0A2L0EN78_SORCE|nr:response regulator [Sorangium cellulosum]AUX40764.1 transcriptional regulator [Sorangium cellulosum]